MSRVTPSRSPAGCISHECPEKGALRFQLPRNHLLVQRHLVGCPRQSRREVSCSARSFLVTLTLETQGMELRVFSRPVSTNLVARIPSSTAEVYHSQRWSHLLHRTGIETLLPRQIIKRTGTPTYPKPAKNILERSAMTRTRRRASRNLDLRSHRGLHSRHPVFL